MAAQIVSCELLIGTESCGAYRLSPQGFADAAKNQRTKCFLVFFGPMPFLPAMAHRSQFTNCFAFIPGRNHMCPTSFIAGLVLIISMASSNWLIAAEVKEPAQTAHARADLWTLYITAMVRAVAMNNELVSESGKSHAIDLQNSFTALELLVLDQALLS